MSFEGQLAALEGMGFHELKACWRRRVGMLAPRNSPTLMRRALDWYIQASAQGGLSRAAQQHLEQLARGKSRTSQAQAGMRLVREWAGEVHVVTIGENEVIRCQERQKRSLSEEGLEQVTCALGM